MGYNKEVSERGDDVNIRLPGMWYKQILSEDRRILPETKMRWEGDSVFAKPAFRPDLLGSSRFAGIFGRRAP
jgi:hypothetical protein